VTADESNPVTDISPAGPSLAVSNPPPARAGSWRRLLAIPTPLIFVASAAVAGLVLWWRGDLSDVGAAARHVAPGFVIGLLALYALGPVMQCLRWQALVQMVSGTSHPLRAAEVFLTSVVVNYAAPIGLAVPTRAALSKRDLGLTARASGAVVLWEAVLDIAILSVLSLIWLVAGDLDVLRPIERRAWEMAPALAVIGLVTGAIVVAVALRRPSWRRRIWSVTHDFIRYPLRRPRPAWGAVGLTLGYWAVQAIVLRLLLQGTGIGAAASPMLVVGLVGLPILVGMLSPLPGGAGVREALMVAVAHAQGVDSAAVLLAAIAYRTALFVTIPILYAAVRFWRTRSHRGAGGGTLSGAVRNDRA
jgi:uncharacterized membrane protein YbhN (UPF0104 family)